MKDKLEDKLIGVTKQWLRDRGFSEYKLTIEREEIEYMIKRADSFSERSKLYELNKKKGLYFKAWQNKIGQLGV